MDRSFPQTFQQEYPKLTKIFHTNHHLNLNPGYFAILHHHKKKIVSEIQDFQKKNYRCPYMDVSENRGTPKTPQNGHF